MDELTHWDKRTKEERAEIRAEMIKHVRLYLAEQDPSLHDDELQRKAIAMVNSAIMHERQRNKVQAASLLN